MTKWPTKKQIDLATQEMEDKPPSRPLAPNASPVERTKYSICKQFVIYLDARNISQQELAEQLGIDKSLMSKIIHYHFDEFTIDRLIKYLAIIDPKVSIEVKAKIA